MGMQGAGSGLSKGKLELATAVPGDVVAGKSFYAGDKELKAGTLTLSGNATAADVLSGKTFYTTNPKSRQTGTRPAGKLVYNLGTGTSFTVTQYAGYKNFTTSNFIVGIRQVNNGRVDFPDRNDSATTFAGVKFTTSYNASTGKLTITPQPVYSPSSTYKAGTMACWNGNETGGIKNKTTVGYTFFAYLVVDI